MFCGMCSISCKNIWTLIAVFSVLVELCLKFFHSHINIFSLLYHKSIYTFQFLTLQRYAPALYQLQYQPAKRHINTKSKLSEDLGQVMKGMMCSNSLVVSSGCLKCDGKKMYLLFLQKNHALDQDHGIVLKTLFTIRFKRSK